MKFLARLFKRLSRRQRLERALRDCDVNILTAIDHIKFGKAMLRTYEKRHAELCAERARPQSPADMRRCIGEPI